MELDRRWVSHERDGKEILGYLAVPRAASIPLSPVLVIQEIWGPDEHIQDLADRVAAAGYVALAPDLYSRGGRPETLSSARVQEFKAFLDTVPPTVWHDPKAMQESLSGRPKDEADRIKETQSVLFGPRDMAAMTMDLRSWIDFLSVHPASQGKPVGSTGYCMGGALSFQLAVLEPRLKVALVYYGQAPDEAELSRVKCPVYGFYGGQDHRITDAVPKVQAKMREHGKIFEAQIYEDAGHAFFNDTRRSYDVLAARDAWARTLAHFNRYLS